MLRFRVDAMSCGHCVQAVTRAVEATDPDAEVRVDLRTKLVEVGTTRPAEAIANALREAGYSPDSLE